MFRSFIGSLVLVLAFPGLRLSNAQSGTSPSNNNIQDAVTSLVRAYENWGPKASTHDASIQIKESQHSGQVYKFRLYAEGLSKDGIYSIVSWPVTQKAPSESLKGVTLDSSGLAICAGTPGTCGGNKPDDPIDLVFRPVPGEPIRLGLVSADGATRALAKIVPVPLRGEDHGCSVEAVLLTPGSELVWIEGSGFPANSELTVDSDSEGERQSRKQKVDADGRYSGAMLPYKQGVPRGTLTVKLKSASCSPTVKVPWGRHDQR